LDPRLIKDINYYNSTVFDIYNKVDTTEEEKTKGKATEAPSAVLLAQGGRFNNLVEMLGGPDIPAVGIKFHVEKLLAVIKENKIEIPKPRPPHVYLAQLSEQAKRQAMAFLYELRQEDFHVMANFSKDSLKSQLDAATKMGARIILILGQREVVDGTILMRDVESGIQEVVNINKVIDEIKKKLVPKKK
jgi:histidyl-tRNA synthetase